MISKRAIYFERKGAIFAEDTKSSDVIIYLMEYKIQIL